jgi:hypothetical protein
MAGIDQFQQVYRQAKRRTGDDTREAGLKIASDFIAKARPDIAKDLRLMEAGTITAATDILYF